MQNILNKKRKGFTLIELIVVIAIIGILVLLAMPKFMDYTRDAKDAKTQHDARVAEDAVTEHLVKNDDKLPEGLPVVTPEDIQDAIDDGRAYDTEGPVAEVPGGPYSDVTDMEEVKAGGIKTDGKIISNNNGDVFIVLDKAIRTDVCVLRADQKMYVASYVFYGNVDSTTYSSPNYENAEAVKAKYPTAEFYKFTEDGKSFIGIFTNNDKKTREVTLVDYYGDGTSVIVPGEIAVKVDSHTTDVHTVIASDVQNVIDPSVIVFQLPCTVTGSMVSEGSGDGPSVCALTEDQKLTGSIVGSKAAHLSWAGKFVSDQVHQVGDYWFGILVEDTTTVELTEYAGIATDIIIPGKIIADGTEYTVAKITGPQSGYGVFETYGANSIEIPCTITYIGEYTFDSNNLTNITIPESVTSIGESAFSYNNLTTVTIPDSVITIGYGAFQDNQLTSVVIGNSVETILDYAFYRNSLNNLTIPDSVVTIEYGAFQRNALTSLTLGNGVQTIGIAAFTYNQLTGVTIPDGVTTIGNSAFESNFLTNVTIPGSVATIGDWAFSYNGALQNSGSLPATGDWTGTWALSGTTWAR